MLDIFLQEANLLTPESLTRLPKNIVRVVNYFVTGSGQPPQLYIETTYMELGVALTSSSSYCDKLENKKIATTDITRFKGEYESVFSYEIASHQYSSYGRPQYVLEDEVIAARYEDRIVADPTQLWRYTPVARCFTAILLHNGYSDIEYIEDFIVFKRVT